jgi:hypothetical protein
VILHAGILALLLGTASVLVLLLAASGAAAGILRRWDFSSSSEGQLRLERRTYLISTILNYAVGFQVASTFLFVYTVDDLHRLLVGAMCATGALNANPVGWWVLGLKVALLFAGGAWIALNLVDQRAEDYPLVRLKYGLLLCLTPLVALDFALELAYFLGIHPDVITSCCGSLFTGDSQGLASTLSGLPVRPAMWGFYGSAAALFAAGAWCLRRPGVLARCVFSAASAWFLVAAGAAIVSFLSLYIYRMPTHHCPFDFLQREYYFFGYPVYGSLLLGTLFGILPALFLPLRRVPSLAAELERLERKWVRLGLFFNAVFLALVSYPVVFGPFRLLPYT